MTSKRKKPGKSGPSKVGYRNPPVDTRFKPGQSGNPAGRPRRPRPPVTQEAISAAIQAALDREINGPNGKMKALELMASGMVTQAAKGNAAIARYLQASLPRQEDIEPEYEAPDLSDFTDEELRAASKYFQRRQEREQEWKQQQLREQKQKKR